MSEKTIIHTVEITKIIRDGEDLLPMEQINRNIVGFLESNMECDHVNVAKVQVFEMDK